MNITTLKSKVDKKLETLIKEIETVHKMKVPRFGLVYDLKGRSVAGQAERKGGVYKIRLHETALKEYGEDYINNTVVHEFAHIVQMSNYVGSKPHGNEWKSIMIKLGKDPKRCHNMNLGDAIMKHEGVKPKTTKTHRYKCGCMEHMLSTVRHNRIQKGINYKCNVCGERLTKGKI